MKSLLEDKKIPKTPILSNCKSRRIARENSNVLIRKAND